VHGVWRRDGYEISTDPARVDVDVVHAFLQRSYWAPDTTRNVLERSIAGSLVFGVYDADGAQVGFARVITDYATVAYMADVFVHEDQRGRGLGVWLVETIVAHPALQGMRVFRLATLDAHGLYEKFGFRRLAHPERMMELKDPLADLPDIPEHTSR
jgi:GNAT superfamily N-acetyltransferase